MTETFAKVGRGETARTETELAQMVAEYRDVDRRWDRVDDLLLEREADERDAADRADLPGFEL